ncbi:DUF4174 domain-containing protein [uncultured Shimia sp.]|uniref:DUF4174 domain-containing protein n=1 Tax=uncultured Shimia sp. TaxID=573152 RepID=UPI00263088DA|nr:DUF4174 domain-containing protein [uncultured Shimia sp.]
MRRLAFVLITFLGTSVLAADGATTDEDPLFRDGIELTLEEFQWLKRPIVVFADSPNDPRFRQQIELLEADTASLETRDVIVLTDTDPAADSALREQLRPRGFMMVLIGKDGVVYLRKPQPWNVREVTRSIDKLPLRQQEERDRRADPIR